MDLEQTFALVLNPAVILTAQGLQPDPWQRSLLLGKDQFLLLNCSRQSGKSTTVAALALHQALVKAGSLGGEDPIDAHNHALAALRYLVTRLEIRQSRTVEPPKVEPTKPATFNLKEVQWRP